MFNIHKFFLSLHLVAAGCSFYCPTLAAPEAGAEVQGFAGNTCGWGADTDDEWFTMQELHDGTKILRGLSGITKSNVNSYCKMEIKYINEKARKDFLTKSFEPLFTARNQMFLCRNPQNIDEPIWLKAEELTEAHVLFESRHVTIQCKDIVNTSCDLFSIKMHPGFKWNLKIVATDEDGCWVRIFMPIPYRWEAYKCATAEEVSCREFLMAEESGAYEVLSGLQKTMWQEAKVKTHQRIAALSGTESEEASYRTQITDTENDMRDALYNYAKSSEREVQQKKTIATLNTKLSKVTEERIMLQMQLAETLEQASRKKGSWLGWTS